MNLKMTLEEENKEMLTLARQMKEEKKKVKGNLRSSPKKCNIDKQTIDRASNLYEKKESLGFNVFSLR